eukprot:scaffold1858_cov56-Attheya_sp.AAC.1
MGDLSSSGIPPSIPILNVGEVGAGDCLGKGSFCAVFQVLKIKCDAEEEGVAVEGDSEEDAERRRMVRTRLAK